METSIHSQINEIELAKPQKLTIKTENGGFELIADEWLSNNLSGNNGAYFIRAILRELNVDEAYILKWRLENKYRQYMILSHYAPNCMPCTQPLCPILNQNEGVKKIKLLFTKGFFLKATLGDASYATQTWDRTKDFDEIVLSPSVCTGKLENYMLQEKIPIHTEIRVHTFAKEIIPALSYVSHGEMQSDYHPDIENFLSDILNKLPDNIINGTLIAWDIAKTDKDQYFIIEANFTGFHPEYRKGFQTTGYVDNHSYGAIICAWLNVYFKKTFGVYVDAVDESLVASNSFYQSFVFYMSLFKSDHFDAYQKRERTAPLTVVIYLGEESNSLIVNLIKHLHLVDYAEHYILIVKDEHVTKCFDIFLNTLDIQFCAESWLFTTSEYEEIRELDDQSRKNRCCSQALKRGTNRIII